MNENVSILIAEDDVDINKLLYKILSKKGYNVRCTYSGSEAEMCIERYNFSLVLLDLMLPGITGEELIGKIRETKTMPIIVISAKPGQDVKIDVLKMGADDFISKPFDVNEVLARVEAQLRRYMFFSKGAHETTILKHKNLALDEETLKVKVKGKEIYLTAKEFAILKILMTYPKKVFTKSNLFKEVWKDDYLGDDNTVNVHMSKIRSKIAEADPDTEYIHTVWGIGFKMSE